MTWQSSRNLLCIRLDSMGDVLMTTPAIRAARQSTPHHSRITLLTSSSGAAAARLVPEIDDVIVYDAPWNKMSDPPASNKSDHDMIHCLRARGFDAAIIFTVFSQNPLPAALLCYLAGIPLRLAHCRENPYHLLTDWVPETDHRSPAVDNQPPISQAQFSRPPSPIANLQSLIPTPHSPLPLTSTAALPIRHEVQRQLDLVAHVGYHTDNTRLSLQVPEQAHTRVRHLLRERGIDVDKPWIPIHAGATAPSRRYPPQHFARVACTLLHRRHIPILFTGTGTERELVAAILAAIDAPERVRRQANLTGELNLAEFAALVELAPVLITNNSGPVHVAAAVQTPVVDLYALTNPQHTPWRVPHRVLYHDVPCKYCYRSICPEGHHRCLRKIEPESVVEAALSLLNMSEAIDNGR